MNKRKQKTLRKRLEERREAIEGDMSYMAAEMRSIGVDQDEENGSLGNHIADDGSNVAEAERIVTVSEDMQQILVQVNSALEHTENRGAAFGLFSGLAPILAAISVAIVAGLLWHYIRQARPPLWQTV